MLKKRIMRMINNIRIRDKLMIFNFLIIMLSLIFVTISTYKSISKNIQNNTIFSARQAFAQTFDYLQYKINNIIYISDAIALDKDLNEGISRGMEKGDIQQQMYDLSRFSLFLKNFQREEDVFHIRIYVSDKLYYSKENINFFSLESSNQKSWVKDLAGSKDRIIWLPAQSIAEENGDTGVVSAARYIRNIESFRKIIGILRIDILKDKLKDIVTKANSSNKGVVYLLNSKGQIVASSNSELSDKFYIQNEVADSLAKGEENWQNIDFENKKLLVGAKNIENTDWKLVSVLPYEQVLASSTQIRDKMIFITVIIGFFAYFFAYLVSLTITKRIRNLMSKMKSVHAGELEPVHDMDGKDEIGELTYTYNYMIDRIKYLLEEEYKLGKNIKNLELKALQAQINPHFLYNTLDLINWMAMENNVPEISSLVLSLSRFYKLSLKKGKYIVSIADEIKHIEIYVSIQNLRFNNGIRLEIDIEEEVYEYSILKLILQPVVENAILHGIMEKKGKKGTIKITGNFNEGGIVIKVCDDGVGMTQEKIEMLLNDKSNGEAGYGVSNINDRLCIEYGQDYGISFKSEINKGTEATIIIPKIKFNEDL